MSETVVRHTPGPWTLPHFVEVGESTEPPTIFGQTHVVKCECGYVFADAQRGMGSICEVRFGGEDEPREIAAANARLIAAAPTMLEALETLIQRWGRAHHGPVISGSVAQDTIDICRAAIAKATAPSAPMSARPAVGGR